MRTRAAAPLIAGVAILAACASPGVVTERADRIVPPGSTVPSTAPDASGPDATDPDAPAPTGELDWEEFADGLEFATLSVPVDYDDPDGDQFDLFMVRRLADDQENKIGSLLINPGGPGVAGSDYAFGADQLFGEELLQRFDIIGWDPRGTGLSQSPIDCIDDYDRYYASSDITPDDEAERQYNVDLAEEFAEECVAANDDILQHVGTNDSARDIDAIRRALGEDQISYFGFSYGSELGGTWATMFPETVRAAVLDGASDPNAGQEEHSLQQAKGFDTALATFLAQCSDDTTCEFHNDGDAEGAFDRLMAELDENPIPSDPDRPDVNLQVARQGVAEAMYLDDLWPDLAAGLADAQAGDGSGLLALHDRYYRRTEDGSWTNLHEAYQAISCADDVERPSVAESDAFAAELNAVAPRLQPQTNGDYMCTFFPPSLEPRGVITGVGAGPIVVIGTTGDAATPLDSTRAMDAALEDGRLVIVTANQHTGYDVNDCVNEVVHRYLVDLQAPADETQC
jgi:pimeloyl-ACP methyl ester carboxylesterase